MRTCQHLFNTTERMTLAGGEALLESWACDSLHFHTPLPRGLAIVPEKTWSLVFHPSSWLTLGFALAKLASLQSAATLKSACSLGPALLSRLSCWETQEANSQWSAPWADQLPTAGMWLVHQTRPLEARCPDQESHSVDSSSNCQRAEV